MNAAYTVTVLGGGALAVRQRIELEVRLARELERLLGGAEEVVGACRAALKAQDMVAAAERWHTAFTLAVQAVREGADLPNVDFRVDLVDGAGRRAAL